MYFAFIVLIRRPPSAEMTKPWIKILHPETFNPVLKVLEITWWIWTMNTDKRMAKGSWSVSWHTKLIRSLESAPLKVHRQLPNVSCLATFLVRTTRVAYLVTVRHQTPTVSLWLNLLSRRLSQFTSVQTPTFTLKSAEKMRLYGGICSQFTLLFFPWFHFSK